MIKYLTYAELSDEDKLLMDDLFIYKAKKETERKILRNEIAQARKEEMDCTKEIMNLSQRIIGEKFELGATSAKPLTNRQRDAIEKRIIDAKKHRPKSGVQGLSFEKQQKLLRNLDEKKQQSQTLSNSKFNCEFPVTPYGRVG